METSNSTKQKYDKITGLQPGWVQIQVPIQIAELLNGINLSHEHIIQELVTILNPDIYFYLTQLIQGPWSRKIDFDAVLFQYLNGISDSSDNLIYSTQVQFLSHINELLTRLCAFEFRKEEQA